MTKYRYDKKDGRMYQVVDGKLDKSKPLVSGDEPIAAPALHGVNNASSVTLQHGTREMMTIQGRQTPIPRSIQTMYDNVREGSTEEARIKDAVVDHYNRYHNLKGSDRIAPSDIANKRSTTRMLSDLNPLDHRRQFNPGIELSKPEQERFKALYGTDPNATRPGEAKVFYTDEERKQLKEDIKLNLKNPDRLAKRKQEAKAKAGKEKEFIAHAKKHSAVPVVQQQVSL